MAEIGVRHSYYGRGFLARLGRWEVGLGWADHFTFPWSPGFSEGMSAGRGLWVPVGSRRALYVIRFW